MCALVTLSLKLSLVYAMATLNRYTDMTRGGMVPIYVFLTLESRTDQ